MRTRYEADTTVARVEERFVERPAPWSGVGKDAVMQRVSTGWWIVTVPPNPVAFSVGPQRPPHSPGDSMKMIMEIDS